MENRKYHVIRAVLLCVLAAAAAAGMFWMARYEKNGYTKERPPIGEQSEAGENMELAGRKPDVAQHVVLGESLAEVTYSTADGREVSLGEMQGETLVLIYWASWCHYCDEELGQLEALERALQAEGDTRLLLVNALDGEKETLEQAEQYLETKHIESDVVYDEGNKVYQMLGIAKLPTMLVLSPDSRIMACVSGKTDGISEFRSMLQYAKDGYALQTLSFITNQMMSKEGGIVTSLNEGNTHPTGTDVLSESQGLLMEYAAESGDQALFDRVYGFAAENLERDSLFLWYTSSEGDPDSNAFLDDLRIYGALLQAQEQWGGYEEDLRALEHALCQYNMTGEGPVDFYDFRQKKKSDTFSLCYGDLTTIRTLEERTGMSGLYEKTKTLMQNGYISDEFPLYYTSWSYREKAYSKESLHTAEAMYTLYHLAKAGLLPERSEQWLMEQLRGNGLLAGYEVDGSVASGNGYESTGIYALTALVGMECGNWEITSLAIERMNRLHIFDQNSLYDGSFGEKDGSGIFSFDQCTALRAYGRMDEMLRAQK